MAVRLGGGIADIMAMIPMLGATGPAWPPGFRLFGPPRAPAAASPGIPIPTARRKGWKLVNAVAVHKVEADQKTSSF